MYNLPWVCFHIHVGVILSRSQQEGAPLLKKIHLEAMMEMIMRTSGLSGMLTASRHRNWYYFVDETQCTAAERYH